MATLLPEGLAETLLFREETRLVKPRASLRMRFWVLVLLRLLLGLPG